MYRLSKQRCAFAALFSTLTSSWGLFANFVVLISICCIWELSLSVTRKKDVTDDNDIVNMMIVLV